MICFSSIQYDNYWYTSHNFSLQLSPVPQKKNRIRTVEKSWLEKVLKSSSEEPHFVGPFVGPKSTTRPDCLMDVSLLNLNDFSSNYVFFFSWVHSSKSTVWYFGWLRKCYVMLCLGEVYKFYLWSRWDLWLIMAHGPIVETCWNKWMYELAIAASLSIAVLCYVTTVKPRFSMLHRGKQLKKKNIRPENHPLHGEPTQPFN